MKRPKAAGKAWWKRHRRRIARRKGLVKVVKSHVDMVVGIRYKEREDGPD